MMSRNVTRLVLDPVAACAARCRRMLDALARLGKRRMRRITFDPGAAAVLASASAVTGLGRVIHLVMLLELRLSALLARGPIVPAAAAGPEPGADASSPETERLQDPEDREAARERDPVERPDRESPDRESFPAFDLGKPPSEDARSLTELAAALCRELGLGPDAAARAKAPFAELETLLAGKPPPAPPKRRPFMDREPPGSPFLRTSAPPDAEEARVDARGPEKPP